MTKYFVWMQGVAGPEPQIIYDEMPKNGEGKLKPYLACHALTDDDKRSIEELRREFAYEQPSEAKS